MTLSLVSSEQGNKQDQYTYKILADSRVSMIRSPGTNPVSGSGSVKGPLRERIVSRCFLHGISLGLEFERRLC
jgi:hypothetical protein